MSRSSVPIVWLALGVLVASPVLGAGFEQARRSGLEMVTVEGGSFEMGGRDTASDGAAPELRVWDECPHRVSVSSYSIGRYEVTQQDWVEVMGALPEGVEPCAECPITGVSWHDAQAFIGRVNAAQNEEFRLPTEEEWEFAARGGRLSRGYLYSGSDLAEEVGWFEANSSGRYHPVGQLAPNELGLYDMSGNLWEWTSSAKIPYPCDWLGRLLDSAVLRGGTYSHRVHNLRVRDRNGRDRSTRLNTLGFRLAR